MTLATWPEGAWWWPLAASAGTAEITSPAPMTTSAKAPAFANPLTNRKYGGICLFGQKPGKSPVQGPLPADLVVHDPVPEKLVDLDHVLVGRGVAGDDPPQLRLVLAEPAHHLGLEQQSQPVPAVRPDDARVAVPGEAGRLVDDPDVG